MRTQTAGEIALLSGANYWAAIRCKVANGSGTLVDLSSWIETWDIDDDIDQPTAQISLSFRRDSATVSLAPLRTDSTLNRLDDGTTYSPQLDAGRLFTFETQAVAINGAVNPSGWHPLFRGYIDSIDAATPSVSVAGRDEGGILQDRWIETETFRYGYGTALEVVIQDILSDHLGGDAPTLYTPVSPAYNIGTSIEGFPLDSGPVMDAIRDYAFMRGWDVRYKWDDLTSSFRLTLYEPPRSNITPARSFTAAMYYDVTRLALDRNGIRNRIVISHVTAPGSSRIESVFQDLDSILRYGQKFFHITEGDDSPIDTTAEATTKGNAALADMKDPKAEMEIEAQFFWPAELHDLYRFPANDVHFNTNQDWAVTNIRQSGTGNGSARTYLQVRGTPAGGYLSWRTQDTRRQPPDRPLFDRIMNFREVARTATEVTIGWTPETTPNEYWLYLLTEAQPVTSDPWALLAGAPTVRLTADTTSYTVTIPQTGYVTYGRLVAIGANGVTSKAWDFTVQPNDQTPAITEPWQTIAAGGLTTDVTFTVTDPAGLGGTLSVWTNHDSAEDADSTGAVEGTFAVASTPATVNNATSFTLTVGGTSALLNDIKVHAGKGKRVFAKFVNSQGVASDVTAILLKPGKPPVEEDGTLTPGIITDYTPFASGLTPVKIVAALPGSGEFTGQTVVLTTDSKLYTWDGSGWVTTVMGTVNTGDIADAAITLAKFASGIRPVRIVGALPGSGDLEGDIVFLTTDEKLYRWTGSAWTVAVDGADIVAASIVAGKLAAGAINASSLFVAGVVGGTAIADGAIITQHMTANTINGDRVTVNTLNGNRLVANSIQAGKIEAGAIGTTELAAGAATIEKLSVATLSGISADLGTITSGHLRNAGDTAAIRLSGATALPSTNYIDFTATGTAPFLKHPGATLLADGTATFKAVKITGDGTSPTISGVTGAQYGTGATISISGKDTAGTITLTTGTVPAGVVGRPNTFCTVTFGTAYASAPYVIVVPISADGAEDVQAPYYGEATTTTFDVKGTAASVAGYSASTIFKWSYVVIG